MGEDERGGEDVDDGDEDSRRPLTIAEFVSELLFNGKTIREIAGFDDVQVHYVLCRNRNKHGQLVRRDPDLPPWVEVDEDGMRVISKPVPYSQMWHQVRERQGWTEKARKQGWQEFLGKHPTFARGGN